MPKRASHRHVAVITLTLDFNKDVGGWRSGGRRRIRPAQRSDLDMMRHPLCDELVSFLILCYPSISRRFLVDYKRNYVSDLESVLCIKQIRSSCSPVSGCGVQVRNEHLGMVRPSIESSTSIAKEPVIQAESCLTYSSEYVCLPGRGAKGLVPGRQCSYCKAAIKS